MKTPKLVQKSIQKQQRSIKRKFYKTPNVMHFGDLKKLTKGPGSGSADGISGSTGGTL
jgi:hypothetical protein